MGRNLHEVGIISEVGVKTDRYRFDKVDYRNIFQEM